jgi:4-carboxymuconolactone decarboxylase
MDLEFSRSYESGFSMNDPAEIEPVWSRPGLSRRDRRFVTLACVAAGAEIETINVHVHAALASGDISLAELLEFTLHFAVYCGWPKGSQVEMAIRAQTDRLATEGSEKPFAWPEYTTDSLGPTDHEQRLTAGERCFVEINLAPAPARDTPYFQAGILAFVFGHLWQRPALGVRERRLITVPCVGVSDAIMPIYSHVGSALESGDITRDEMTEVIRQFAAYSGSARAEVLDKAADESWARIAAKTPNPLYDNLYGEE